VGCVVTPIILLVLLLLVAVTIVTVLIMKYVLAFGFAVAFVGGPVALGAGGIPGVGEPALNMLLRSVCVFMIIPLVWCICFAAWVGVVASTIDTPSGAGDAVLQVVNGPGMFAAAMLVLLGVTRKLLQMAMPLGAPLGLPGPLRFLLAAAAMKFGGPIAQVAMDKVSGSGSTGQGPSLTEQEMVRAHNESSNSTATRALPMPAPRATSSETTADELAAVAGAGPPPTEDPDTLMPATASGWGPSNEALRGAAERVAGLRESGARLDIEGAWAGMSDDERASAAAAAEQAFRQPVAADQQAAYEQHMIRATAAGEFINPNAAAVLSTAHPSQIQALAADSAATTSVPESAPQPDVRTDAPTLAEHLRNGDWRQEDMIGGADMSALIPPAPPPAPPPPDGAP
jgi:hypothetical protein